MVFFAYNAQASNFIGDLTLRGKEAKHLYDLLTGPQVQRLNIADHQLKRGASIVCSYTKATITEHGKTIPLLDPRRYVCETHIDANGLASPDKNP